MNYENLHLLIDHYIEKYDIISDEINNESYKWEAVEHFQQHWNLEAEDFSTMFKEALRKTDNLIDNKTVQPTAGILEIAKYEPETIREMFQRLYTEDHGDLEARQVRVEEFIDKSKNLLEKYANGKWKFAQDNRAVIFYLSLRYPEDNYMYKAREAREFAECIEYSERFGSGKRFQLAKYYRMCDLFVRELRKRTDIINMHKKFERDDTSQDASYHILAYDIIYCAHCYHLYQDIEIRKRDTKNVDEKKMRLIEIFQKKRYDLKIKLEQVAEEKQAYEDISLISYKVNHVKYGTGIVSKQENRHITINFQTDVKKFVLPNAFTDKFLTLEDKEIDQYFEKYGEILKRERKLQMQLKDVEIKLY